MATWSAAMPGREVVLVVLVVLVALVGVFQPL